MTHMIGSLLDRPHSSHNCEACGFDLHVPIYALGHSNVGLYDDARFPGRCIVSLRQHFDYLEDVPPDSALGFHMDIRRAVIAIRAATSCDRVNVAILGNTESHVHAHLIPRYSAFEALPGKSPWNDPRPSAYLEREDRDKLIRRISEELDFLARNSRSGRVEGVAEGAELLF